MFNKRIYILTAAVAVVGMALAVGSAGASPSTYTVKATLSTHGVSVKDATGARGTLTGKLTVAGKHSAFVWTLRFNGLSGQARRAGIYFTKTKQLGMLLCLKCTSGARSSYHGSYVANKTFLNALLHRGFFVAIRTKLNPNGEIRGQLKTTATST